MNFLKLKNASIFSQKPARCDKKNESFLEAKNDVLVFDKGIESDWLSCKEAAHFLRITPNALRILVCRGRVRAYKFCNRLRFRKDDLKALLVKQEVSYGN